MYDIETDAPHIMGFNGLVGHNSQGLTLDKVQVDLYANFLGAPNMLYVATSLARTPKGLSFVGTPQLLAQRCKVAPEVVRWL